MIPLKTLSDLKNVAGRSEVIYFDKNGNASNEQIKKSENPFARTPGHKRVWTNAAVARDFIRDKNKAAIHTFRDLCYESGYTTKQINLVIENFALDQTNREFTSQTVIDAINSLCVDSNISTAAEELSIDDIINNDKISVLFSQYLASKHSKESFEFVKECGDALEDKSISADKFISLLETYNLTDKKNRKLNISDKSGENIERIINLKKYGREENSKIASQLKSILEKLKNDMMVQLKEKHLRDFVQNFLTQKLQNLSHNDKLESAARAGIIEENEADERSENVLEILIADTDHTIDEIKRLDSDKQKKLLNELEINFLKRAKIGFSDKAINAGKKEKLSVIDEILKNPILLRAFDKIMAGTEYSKCMAFIANAQTYLSGNGYVNPIKIIDTLTKQFNRDIPTYSSDILRDDSKVIRYPNDLKKTVIETIAAMLKEKVNALTSILAERVPCTYEQVMENTCNQVLAEITNLSLAVNEMVSHMSNQTTLGLDTVNNHITKFEDALNMLKDIEVHIDEKGDMKRGHFSLSDISILKNMANTTKDLFSNSDNLQQNILEKIADDVKLSLFPLAFKLFLEELTTEEARQPQ